jgi:phosphoribosylformylglycinamidine synthase subunit PurL
VLEDAAHLVTMGFRAEGDLILLLDGRNSGDADADASATTASERSAAALREFSSSEYARTIAGIVGGAPPQIDLAAESRLIDALVAAAAEGLLASAHDLSDGGLAVALAESCFTSASAALSATISLHACEQAELALFGERGARAIVSLPRNHLARVLALAAQYGLAAREIGSVARGPFSIKLNERLLVSADVPLLADAWAGAVERLVLGPRAPGQL